MNGTTSKENRRCCGMDVHKETVVVCVLPRDAEEGKTLKKVYGTFRNDLGRMRGWLKAWKVTDIAMESTGLPQVNVGVNWRPLWNVLEGHGLIWSLKSGMSERSLALARGRVREGAVEFGLLDRRGLVESCRENVDCWRRVNPR